MSIKSSRAFERIEKNLFCAKKEITPIKRSQLLLLLIGGERIQTHHFMGQAE